jgi:transposase, IS5 family
MKRKPIQKQGDRAMSFFAMEMDIRLKEKNVLFQLKKLLDWNKIGKILEDHKKETSSQGGQVPYDALKMFKAVLLGQWYNLSDPQLEQHLTVRVDFMYFTGFEMIEHTPDETTLCRFRNALSAQGLDKILFGEINRQLEEKSLKVRECNGAIVDATIVEAASKGGGAKPQESQLARDRHEDESSAEESARCSKKNEAASRMSLDARWLKKGKRSYFGYKGFFTVDSVDGYVERVHATPGNCGESPQFLRAVLGMQGRKIYADKAYASRENERILSAMNCKDGILKKSSRGHPLTAAQKRFNTMCSKVRWRVEQCFGTLKRKFAMSRSSYLTLARTQTQMCLKAMCYNLLKACNKQKLSPA